MLLGNNHKFRKKRADFCREKVANVAKASWHCPRYSIQVTVCPYGVVIGRATLWGCFRRAPVSQFCHPDRHLALPDRQWRPNIPYFGSPSRPPGSPLWRIARIATSGWLNVFLASMTEQYIYNQLLWSNVTECSFLMHLEIKYPQIVKFSSGFFTFLYIMWFFQSLLSLTSFGIENPNQPRIISFAWILLANQ